MYRASSPALISRMRTSLSIRWLMIGLRSARVSLNSSFRTGPSARGLADDGKRELEVAADRVGRPGRR